MTDSWYKGEPKQSNSLGWLLFICIFAIVCFFGCQTVDDKHYEVDDWSVQVIDSCEYITSYTYGGFTSLTHKGNCKFCKVRKQCK